MDRVFTPDALVGREWTGGKGRLVPLLLVFLYVMELDFEGGNYGFNGL
jgi:hypothetical protein